MIARPRRCLATLPGAHGESTAVVGDWQKVVNDARLKKVVSIALNSNRDVQKALADIEAARAQYGETRASLFPTVDAELSHTRSKTVASGLSSASQADGAVSSFELDLFGKNQSLSRAARETWLASEFTAQNTRLTMIADLTTAWVTLATDNSNLALAQQTMDSAANSRNIVARQMAVGTASAGDVSSAESVYQQARASVASYRTLVAQDKNAINLLAGETVPESLLPGTLESLGDNSIALVPAGRVVVGAAASAGHSGSGAQSEERQCRYRRGAGELLPVDFPDRQRRGRQRLAVVAVQPRDAGVVVRPLHQPAAVHRRQQPGAAALCGSGEKGADRHLREIDSERV